MLVLRIRAFLGGLFVLVGLDVFDILDVLGDLVFDVVLGALVLAVVLVVGVLVDLLDVVAVLARPSTNSSSWIL